LHVEVAWRSTSNLRESRLIQFEGNAIICIGSNLTKVLPMRAAPARVAPDLLYDFTTLYFASDGRDQGKRLNRPIPTQISCIAAPRYVSHLGSPFLIS